MKKYPDGDSYQKKASDMKRLTSIEKLTQENKPLSREDLLFLYEANAPIEGFGDDYGTRDPRIDEVRGNRDKRADLRTIFDCTEEELQEKEHFTLKNIPDWEELPGPKKLKQDFNFDHVWESEYRVGRPMTDFENPNKTEAEPVAKIFEIGDVIRKKQKEDPEHPNYLTTAEVLEAIDEAGYRPATLQELLAFARDYWKPDVDPKVLTMEEKLLQNVQAPYISVLNSMFSEALGHRHVPYLNWYGGERQLFAYWLGRVWRDLPRFLVLRKASS